MIPNTIITYAQMVRSYYIQQLIEKSSKSDLKTCMGVG